MRKIVLLFFSLCRSDNIDGVRQAKEILKSIDIMNLEELKYFLGVETCKIDDRLFLSQKYTLDLVSKTWKLDSKSCKKLLIKL